MTTTKDDIKKELQQHLDKVCTCTDFMEEDGDIDAKDSERIYVFIEAIEKIINKKHP